MACGDDGCGGSCGQCKDTESCEAAQCVANPSCNDGTRNGEETDVDCGGSCNACVDGERCAAHTDCASGSCSQGKCISCEDERRNGTETDVDCGGSCTRKCQPGKACAKNTDCASSVCEGGTCVAAATCTDGLKNGSESDADCGGGCSACATGKFCRADGDCLSRICTNGLCRDPSCTDGRRNQDESDVDCGGQCARKCEANQSCQRDADCASTSCAGGKCAACLNKCTSGGATRCLGDQVQTCVADVRGCLDWSAATACGSGRICDGTRNACTNVGCGSVPVEGHCLDTKTIEFCASTTGGGTPFVRTTSCAANEACSEASGRATCVLTAACRDGATSCASASELRTCAGGQWTTSTCANGCNAENPLAAFCNPPGATRTITGTVKYDARFPNANRTDWGPAAPVPAQGFLVLSYADLTGSGTPTTLDVAYTGEGGAFSIKVPSTPRPNDVVVVAAVGVKPDGSLRFVVGNPGFAQPGEQQYGVIGPNPSVWSWSWKVQSLPTGNALMISEANGSGAARVFDYLRYVFSIADALFPQRSGLSLVAWVGFGTDWTCGACFTHHPAPAFGEQFASQIWMPGGPYQEYWADSVIAHELGHWVMQSFGTSPDEGGTHFLGVPTFPGQAWSEGFATWFSSIVRKDSVYLDKQGNGMFWVDLAGRAYSSGRTWQRPTPSGGLLQKMDENEVSAMLLSIAQSSDATPVTMLSAFAGQALNTPPFERGYTRHSWEVDRQSGNHFNVVDTRENRPSLPDFLDALNCSGFPRDTIDSATQPASRYPYPSNAPICTGTCSPSTCSGCCSNGVCVQGASANACGANGGACMTCNAGQTCTNGACVGGSCSPATCPSGCCTGTTCVTTGSNSSCGTGGAICRACGSGQVCSAGACRVAEGGLCTGSGQCAAGMGCLAETETEGSCRRTCNPASPNCGSGFNCLELNGGSGACVPAPGGTSRWKIYFDSAVLRAIDPSDGAPWDADNSAPDPYVCVRIGTSSPVCSTKRDNTLTPSWGELTTSDFSYSTLAAATFEIWDSDLFSNDLVDTYVLDVRSPWAGKAWAFAGDHSQNASAGSERLVVLVGPVP